MLTSAISTQKKKLSHRAWLPPSTLPECTTLYPPRASSRPRNCIWMWGSTRTSGAHQRLGSPPPFIFSHVDKAPRQRSNTPLSRELRAFFSTKAEIQEAAAVQEAWMPPPKKRKIEKRGKIEGLKEQGTSKTRKTNSETVGLNPTTTRYITLSVNGQNSNEKTKIV